MPWVGHIILLLQKIIFFDIFWVICIHFQPVPEILKVLILRFSDLGVLMPRVFFVKDIFAKNTYFRNICMKSAYISDVYMDIRNLIFQNSYIYNFANSSWKFAAIDPRLLVYLELVMLVSFCLFL